MSSKQQPKDISDKYQKLEHKEHVLTRPGMYIGAIEEDTYDTWVMNRETKKMEKKLLKYIPGLFKIFDEILVNAIDHSVRLRSMKTTDDNVNLMKTIKVNINQEDGTIEVVNDGDGIEVVEHPEHKIYIPELIFGNLLTSTNYDDSVERVIGGCNGLGSKAANIFSEWFEVETVDRVRKLIYKQRFETNMSVVLPPSISKYSKKPYTSIKFKPDLAKFKIQLLSDEMMDMFVKRVYDVCAVTDNDISVYLNETKLEYKNFEKYVDLYIGSKDEHTRVYEKISDRWEIVASYNDFNGFDQISFVNGVWTIRGGKHVEYILNQIVKKLSEMILKKNKNANIKPQNIRDNIILFVRSTIVNPSFDSQSKETLTTPISKFGSKAEVSDKFIEKLYKTGIAEKVMEICEMNNNKDLKKTDGKKKSVIKGIPKLDDANWAGTNKSKECTLILTEGDSAKTMVLAGISQVGRDKYGVFPLKGKVMNVKDTNVKKITDNEEISNLKKILGLETGKDYKSLDDLRYGRIMLMCDSDSVSGDTPLLLKNPNGNVEIHNINRLTDSWTQYINGKEYGQTNYEIWTEKGWTKIKHVMRHKVDKEMFRVLTHTGCVDVTEDHSLLNDKAEKISPKECVVGQNLLHSFPAFTKPNIPDINETTQYPELCKIASLCNIKKYQTYRKTELISLIQKHCDKPVIAPKNYCDITLDEAYVMGLFWADGSCGIYSWENVHKPKNRPKEYTFNRTSVSWAISNNDLALLEKAKQKLMNVYPLNLTIAECINSKNKIVYKLILNGGSKVNDFVERYNNLFYYKNEHKRYKFGNKYIPSEILNASFEVRETFLEGFYAGDGAEHDIKTAKNLSFDVEGKIGSQGLYYLCKSLGYDVSINTRIDKPEVYRILLTRPTAKQQGNPLKIKKIHSLGKTEQYVYDLETENHHFQAGVGEMIVHNTDGFHIKALVFNLFQTLWPSLFKTDNFLATLLTPIVKASHNQDKKNTISFYCNSDYENWKKEQEENGTLKRWKIKYYKGLGTSTNEEAKQYFKDLKIVTYEYTKDETDFCIDLAFNKKKADERKDWLTNYNRNNVLDYNCKVVKFEDFINKELIHFSNYDIERSIPNLMDGLKISQRKILFACYKRNLVSDEIRVAQLASYVSEHACYHHGEASLQSAIIAMAQNFVGANNINLLKPNGQFGSVVQGGKDAGAPRYIYTLLEKITQVLFNKQDNGVLTYLNDDGISVEPEYYVPVIPLILVNGAIGIGTGFSTNVPSYNPIDIIAIIKNLLTDTDVEFEELVPWYMGFQGTIENNNDKYVSRGCFKKLTSTKVEITELPVGTWTEDFKMLLEEMVDKDLKCYESQCTDKKVLFTLQFMSSDVLDTYMTIASNGYTKLENDFKLVSSKNLGTTNMYLYNHKGQITKYTTALDIIVEFYQIRLSYYTKRKQYVIEQLEKDMEVMRNKIRFIRSVVSEEVKVSTLKKAELEMYLASNDYLVVNDSYDYLLKIPIYNITKDKVTEIEDEFKRAEESLNEIKAKTEKDMWLEELELFEKEYLKFKEEYLKKHNENDNNDSSTNKSKKVSKK